MSYRDKTFTNQNVLIGMFSSHAAYKYWSALAVACALTSEETTPASRTPHSMDKDKDNKVTGSERIKYNWSLLRSESLGVHLEKRIQLSLPVASFKLLTKNLTVNNISVHLVDIDSTTAENTEKVWLPFQLSKADVLHALHLYSCFFSPVQCSRIMAATKDNSNLHLWKYKREVKNKRKAEPIAPA